MKARDIVAPCIVAALPFLAGFAAIAQEFPTRPMTIVVPYSGGGTTDVNARRIAEKASKLLGQNIIVENRPGGGAIIAATYVKRAAPDGYTMMIADLHTHAINASLHSKLPYDPVADFSPITLLWNYPSVVTVPASSPANSIKELVELARKSPKGLTYGSPGVGTTSHLMPEQIKRDFKVNLIHVPYKGVADATNDLIAGRIDFLFAGVNALVAQLAQTNKVKLLAVTDSERSGLLPNVPTMAEAGFPGFESRLWAGVVAPANTPSNVVDKLNKAFVAASRDPDFVRLMTAAGNKISTTTAAEFAELIKSDGKLMAKMVEQAGIKKRD